MARGGSRRRGWSYYGLDVGSYQHGIYATQADQSEMDELLAETSWFRRWEGRCAWRRSRCSTGQVGRPIPFFLSGGKDKKLGTGFVRGKMQDRVFGFTAISERMCKLRIRGRFFNYSIINVHCPHEEKSDDEKEAFYATLEEVYDGCPRQDVKVIIGDLNARFGREEMYRPTIGPESLHSVTNDNGQRCIDFAASRGMVPAAPPFNTACLQNGEVAHRYAQQLEANLPGEEELGAASLEDGWSRIRSAIGSAAEATLGSAIRVSRNDWYDDECQRITAEKKAAYDRKLHKATRGNVERCRQARNRQVAVFKLKKRQQEDRDCTEMEQLFRANESRKFYEKVNRSAKASCREPMWKQYFNEHLNGDEADGDGVGVNLERPQLMNSSRRLI
ncbi:uncharacterized protein LOC119770038 [Culex quinquefasciatus]|uniref:uncharacterized protein LOC119770038 n=1 Tax=Culex quinquefasciatus TaxID=7176 RepID=UPI0018E36F7A|nr:uncharacterized protein LOC119770038 [Culex quinquefasciatus]